MPGETLAELDAKRARLAETDRYGWRLQLLADLVAGSALRTAEHGLKDMGRAGDEERRPVHWPLEFPEVFLSGGFDGIVGNPPFVGGKKITNALGTEFREYAVPCIGRSVRGNADLVAYFVLRAHDVLNQRGQTGIIATNTLAQGDTREVGLDQLLADGVTIKAAIKSERWPSRSAVLEYCAVWTSGRTPAERATRYLDRRPTMTITATLDPGSRSTGHPRRLASNLQVAFAGSYILGKSFIVESAQAQQLVKADPRNAAVLFPYLNGQDLNSRPDCSAARWVINFHNWPEERARSYSVLFAKVERTVKPVRQASSKQVADSPWWLYWRQRPALHAAIAGLETLIAIAAVSKLVLLARVRTAQVLSSDLRIFATNEGNLLALLSGAAHYWWALSRSSTMKGDLRYNPSDAFETFAWPEPTEKLSNLGDQLDGERREYMLGRQAGLTATYNLVHDPGCTDADIVNLREIHRAIDHATFAAYGWTDLDPVHDHFDTRQGVRWTIDPANRQEMLGRLLELNHERYAAEQGTTVQQARQEGLF